MKKSLLIIIIIATAAFATFYIWAGIAARQKSSNTISNFQEVNNSLASSDDSGVAKGGIGAVKEVYLDALMKSQLILLIDSLKENYEIVPDNLKQVRLTKELRSATNRLLSYIQDYNQLKKTAVDSQMPDTITYNSGLDKFNSQKWLSDYFEAVPKEVSISYLNYLRNQLIKSR